MIMALFEGYIQVCVDVLCAGRGQIRQSDL